MTGLIFGQTVSSNSVAETVVQEESLQPRKVGTSVEDLSTQVTEAIRNMEYLRGFRDSGFSFMSEVITVEGEDVVATHWLSIKVSEKGYSVIEILSPEDQKGRRTLVRDTDMWLYLPSSVNVIRIAPLQKVFGQASIADVLNTSYIHDYQVTRQEIDQEGDLLFMELTSKEGDATYAKIDVQYDLRSQRPVITKHYTRSGRLLKTIEYVSFSEYGGQVKMEKIKIKDALKKEMVIWIRMHEFRKDNHPDSMFTKNGFKRL